MRNVFCYVLRFASKLLKVSVYCWIRGVVSFRFVGGPEKRGNQQGSSDVASVRVELRKSGTDFTVRSVKLNVCAKMSVHCHLKIS